MAGWILALDAFIMSEEKRKEMLNTIIMSVDWILDIFENLMKQHPNLWKGPFFQRTILFYKLFSKIIDENIFG